MLDDLSPSALPRLMRRTMLSGLVVGAAGFVVAIFLHPSAGLGLAIGLCLAIWNFRQLDRSVARADLSSGTSTKTLRRQLSGKTATRLFLMTVIVLAGLWLNGPLGIGIVSGLVIYQIVFVVNVALATKMQRRM